MKYQDGNNIFYLWKYTLASEWIDQMNRVRYTLDHTNLTNASSLMSQFKRQTNDAILANRNDLHTVREFAIECIAVDILGHDRFRDLVTARNGRH